MKNIFFSVLALVFILNSEPLAAQKLPSLRHAPGEPALFGNTLINTPASERDFALSPDGNEMFYTIQSPVRGGFQTIVYRRKDANGNWSKPIIPHFAGRYNDLEPAFSIDGKRLYFTSNRPIIGDAPKDFDIWFVEKANSEWGEARNLGSPVNTAADEFYPSITGNGNLYFTASYKSGIGKEDIYIAHWDGTGFRSPVALDSSINSPAYEFNAFVSPDENIIIFSSYGRKDEMGGGDLYMSIKDSNGKWRPCINLSFLNSDKIDYCPFVSFDGSILFFTSERTELRNFYENKVEYDELIKKFTGLLNGGGNIYWVSMKKVMDMFLQEKK